MLGSAVVATAALIPSPPVESDEDLMVQVQAGSEQALALLMDRWRAPLYGFLTRRVGDASDDVFQESWIRVVRARDRFDPERRFSTWLFQIANNLCRDRWRRLSARGRALEAFSRESLATRVSDSEPEIHEGDSMRARVLALPEKQREVLILRYYQDLSEAEIAEVLAIPKGTVKSRMHTAVKSLRRVMEEEGVSQ